MAAYDCDRRGFAIVHDSGNRQLESHLAGNLAMLAADHGDRKDALSYLTLALRNHLDSGSFSLLLTPLALLARLLYQLGQHLGAATIAGFADTPFTRGSFLEMEELIADLREAVADDVYEACGRVGQAMSPAAMVAYSFEQIDIARARLSAGEA